MTGTVPMVLPANYRSYDLPWTRDPEERRRLRKITTVVGATALILALVMPFLPSKPVEFNQAPELPPRLAKLLIERKTPPAPPPEIIKPPEEIKSDEPKPEPKKEPEPEPIAPPKPAPKPVPKLALVPEPVAPPPVNAAREKAKKVGLVAMADDLADLRDTSAIDNALNNNALSNTVGAAARNERSMLTSGTGRASSGGINTANLSRNTGGQALAGRSVTEVTSTIASASATASGSLAGSSRPQTAGQRSRDQIELIFDRNKAAIYALYRRALRKDPSLQGKLVLELTITAAGRVTDCRVLSSELNAPEFEQRLVKRVRMFDFGAQDVDTVTTTKPIDFFPV